MKTTAQILFLLLITYITLCLSCQKLDPVPVSMFVTTPPAININYTSANVKGELMDIGEGITSYGHCWAKTSNPTISGSKSVINGMPPKQVEFTSDLRALTPGTKYYVRAYITNSAGTVYGNEINFTTNAIPSQKIVDCDNNLYDTVKIDTQIWMKSNLKVTRLNDGLDIPLVTQNSDWLALNNPGYCWSNNDEIANKNTYGALYNWFAANSGKLCPAGWHVSTDAEWIKLINFAGGLTVAGGKLKETGTIHWAAPNNGATNETGFTALPGGCRSGGSGIFYALGQWGNYLTATPLNAYQIRTIAIGYQDSRIFRDSICSKSEGMAVRCVKD
jgi:uncharacterized protein (TIGR02145 family)